MKRKTRFSPGGDAVDNPSSQYEDDELSRANQMFLASQGPEDRSSSAALYDETSGKELSTRRNLETGEYYSTEPIARAAVRSGLAPKAAVGSGRGDRGGPSASEMAEYYASRRAPASGRGEIPVDTTMRGPASAGEMPGETERNLRNLMSAATPGAVRAAPAIGRGVGALMSSAREGFREGEKLKEVARAAERGAKSRADIQAKRAVRQKAEAMEKAKPILQSRKDTKASRAARTRRTEEDMGIEFSKGGSASRRADGCAVRGKTRGKIY